MEGNQLHQEKLKNLHASEFYCINCFVH
jgi:hypothetical protein